MVGAGALCVSLPEVLPSVLAVTLSLGAVGWARWRRPTRTALQVYLALTAGLLPPPWIYVLLAALPALVPQRVALTAAACALLGLSHGADPLPLLLLGLAGAVLDRRPSQSTYRLEKKLGQGGMGEVWLARHEMLSRPVAIKMIHSDTLGGDPDTAREILLRFQREARATAALHSPHTVSLYDFSLADDGTFYYVMEYLDGLDLDTLVERFGPVPPSRAIHLVVQACSSLAEAHAAGLVHRDIKPANLYACRSGLELDFIKVLDFGLVTPPPKQGEELKLTAPSTVFGTPAFMSPEQAGAETTDQRSDIYSMGCVLYWLVTGKLVFEGEAMRTAIDLLTQKPKPPSARALQAISPDFDEVVLACLAKAPADRPQTMGALAGRLNACQDASLWTPELASAWWSAAGL